MVEMTKAHNLNIYKYLKFLPEQRPSKEWTDEQFEKLAPCSSEAQALYNNTRVNFSHSRKDLRGCEDYYIGRLFIRRLQIICTVHCLKITQKTHCLHSTKCYENNAF